MNRFICLTIVLVMLLLSACGTTSSSTSSDKKDPVKLGFSALPTWFLWHLVEEKGFFEKHGVDVELVYFPVYGDSISALNVGELDANSQALLDTIAPLERGLPIKAVFATDSSAGGDGLVVKSEINEVADLKGKTVGTEIGTIAHFFLLTILKDAGMTEKDVNFTNLTIQDAGSSFIAGQLDAAELWEPFLSTAVEGGNGKILVDSNDYPGLISDVIVMRDEFLKERPEDAQKIVDAWFDALAYLQTNPEESIGIIAKAAELSEEEIAIGFEGFHFLDLEENKEAFQKGETFVSLYHVAKSNAEFLLEQGFIKEIPDFDKLFDASLITE